jgi:hypothetical protein
LSTIRKWGIDQRDTLKSLFDSNPWFPPPWNRQQPDEVAAISGSTLPEQIRGAGR